MNGEGGIYWGGGRVLGLGQQGSYNNRIEDPLDMVVF